MFPHYLAGCLSFLLLAEWCNLEITWWLLLLGALLGALPDWLSLFWGNLRFDKWGHKHRDNPTHTLIFPAFIFLLFTLIDRQLATMIGLALLTHPLLDSFGIGWGVKPFAPFSDLTVKFGHIKGKWLYTEEEIDAEAEKFGDDNWVRNCFSGRLWSPSANGGH